MLFVVGTAGGSPILDAYSRSSVFFDLEDQCIAHRAYCAFVSLWGLKSHSCMVFWRCIMCFMCAGKA